MTKPVALITGATRGIGRAIAEDLAADHTLLIGGRDLERTAAVCAEFPDASPFACELSDVDALRAAAREVERLDVLIHSAGVATYPTVADATPEQWRDVFATNVFAVAELTRLMLPRLRDARGLVITINSGSGFSSGPRAAIYSGSKFALRAFTDALRAEERGTVRVSSVHPGRVATDMQVEQWAEYDNPAYRPEDHLQPVDVARAVRMIVDADPRASIDELQIRPAVGKSPA